MDDLDIARACAAAMLRADRSSRALGIDVDVTAPGSVTARMTVRDDMINGFDVCHGGLVFALADTAFAFACNGYDHVTVAAGASIEFVRPANHGDELTARATEDHRGRRTGHYTVRVVNQSGELVALFRGRSVSRDESILAPGSDTDQLEMSKKA